MQTQRLVPATLIVLLLAACTGSTGPAGTPALDTGTISGTVKSSTGAAISGAAVTTNPATTSATTDSNGAFTFSSIPIGSYQVTATMTGYASAQQPGVGVAAGATTQVSLTLSPAANAAGSVTGTVFGRQGAALSVALGGATVCLEGAGNLPCATSKSDGTFALPNVPPGPAFLSATAPGLLPSETREAVFVSAAAATSGVAITLSGSPGAGATYVGVPTCLKCHEVFDGGLVGAWQSSAHATTIDLTLGQVDVNGWPAAPASCAAPNTKDSTVAATDPAKPTSTTPTEVWLARWPANCTGQPQFAMFFDTNGNGKIDPGETVIPVQGTQGGVAGDVGNCGQGGILPTANPCSANYLTGGSTAAHGWWQQEYLVSIAAGAGKPAWVSWDTTNTPEDLMALPATWDQRTLAWAPAPDYWTSFDPTHPQAGTFSKQCAGCHDTGVSLTADANGYVTQYGHIGATAPHQIPQNIACERCHGPGSAHANSGGQAQFIINPQYLTAQARDDICGQCHTNLVSSTQPAGVFGFTWNNQATTGGGNFIPGIHTLTDFASFPAYGTIGTAAPLIYWPGGVFVALDHMTYVDVLASAHNTNPYDRVTCSDCHESHGLAGGPYQMQRTDTNGDQYVFQSNDAAMRNDVLCLSCHATHEDFSSVQLTDAANYHISTGNGCSPTAFGCPAVQKNGAAYAPSTGDVAASVQVVTAAVNAHMLTRAGMPAFFDPTASTQSQPVGRCSSCHMAKTASTAVYFTAMVGSTTANIAGDVTTHSFMVAGPQDSLNSLNGLPAYAGTTPMPNACGTCHSQYLVGH